MIPAENKYSPLFLILGYFLLFTTNLTSGQIRGSGRCPEVEIEPIFNFTAYLGEWYEHSRYPNVLEKNVSCVLTVYSGPDVSRLAFVTTFAELDLTKAPVTLKGIAIKEEPFTTKGKLILHLGGQVKQYWILKTDYESYSLVWSCADFHSFHLKYFWILTRSQNPSEETISKINQEIDKRNFITKIQLEKTRQENCKKPKGI